ncbi:MAG: TolC family protein, partial [Bryobacteraceae bacterium]
AYQQSFLPGTSVSLSFSKTRSSVNSPSSLLNPALSGNMDLYVTQNLLQGFGRSVNNRNIRVARNNAKVTDLQLQQQIITTVSAVLNLYWDLVSFKEDVRLKEQALATARKLFEDNQKELQLGVVATIDVTRAQAEVPSREEDLLAAQTNVQQQEIVLKSALSKNGVEDPLLEEVHVIPLDHFQVPEKEQLTASKELVKQALARRPDLEQARINIRSTLVNLEGSRNALHPTLQAFAEFTNHALAGAVNLLNVDNQYGVANPYYIGGYGDFLGQIFRRNFPDYSVGVSLNIPFRNRAAQADYATDQLNLRTSELQLQRSVNQVGVDVRNAAIGLRQAHARFEIAVQTRQLAEQTLKAEQMKYQLGDSTVFLVIQAQRDLVTAQDDEVQAMANYSHARIAFDQALGVTLDTNHISLGEASAGRVERQSSLPDSVLR